MPIARALGLDLELAADKKAVEKLISEWLRDRWLLAKPGKKTNRADTTDIEIGPKWPEFEPKGEPEAEED